MPRLLTLEGHTFSPDGKVAVSAEEAATINAETDAAELAHWATAPDTFAPAYFTFPAESEVIFGVIRSYRRNFTPNLHTYINAEKIGDPGTAKHAAVSTWHGTIIGWIISARVYGHNFGGRHVAIRVKGTNGATYYGRASWDNGNVIRLRKAK